MNKNLLVFRDICRELYRESSVLATEKGSVVYGNGYGKVISLVLQTKYKKLIPIGGLTLEEIGYIFGTTRERTRQVLDGILGTSGKGNYSSSTRVKKKGKLLTPNGNKKKMEAIYDLRDYLRVVYGQEIEKG